MLPHRRYQTIREPPQQDLFKKQIYTLILHFIVNVLSIAVSMIDKPACVLKGVSMSFEELLFVSGVIGFIMNAISLMILMIQLGDRTEGSMSVAYVVLITILFFFVVIEMVFNMFAFVVFCSTCVKQPYVSTIVIEVIILFLNGLAIVVYKYV